ncbi:MAG: mechanosensitive ion channel family protein [Leptospirales bacterium]
MLKNILSKLHLDEGIFADYPIIITVIILLSSFVVAKIVTLILVKVIGRFAKRTRVEWDDQIVTALHKPIILSLMLLSLWLTRIPWDLLEATNNLFKSIIITVLIIIWTTFLIQLIRIVLRAMSQSSHKYSMVRVQTRPLFENLGFILVLIVAVYIIFKFWDIDMTAWLASAGVIGIAVGFAAKDTLANLFSGVFILADAPYQIGDYVVLDGGERGKVTHIGIRSTRLLTREDVEITIPNAIMGNTRIINESGGPYEKYRLRVSLGVAYGSDIDHVKKILMEIAIDEPLVCDNPEPKTRFRSFGASSLDIDLLCWVENPEVRGSISDILNTTIYKRFNAEGIEIPYSKHDIFIKEMPQKDRHLQ